MKKFKVVKERMRDYWQNLMKDRSEKKLSRGAQKINKIISWARGDNWRRKNEKK